MRQGVLAIAAGLTFAAFPPPAPAYAQDRVDVAQVYAPDLQRVAATYEWSERYEETVDGLIGATRSFASFWTGSHNRGTEDERIARARELVLAARDDTLSDAADRLASAIDASELAEHLGRIESGAFGEADVPYREAVHKAYRDAIFDELTRAARQANQEIEGR